jgi:hypothetical protein
VNRVLIARMNAAEEIIAEFNDWYNKEHMERARSIPGFGSDHRRYEALALKGKYWDYRPDPRFTAIYPLERDGDIQASIDSEEYGRWSGDFIARWRDRTRDEVSIMCEQIFGHESATDYEVVLLAQMNVDPGREREFNTWYNEIHIPQAAEIPGFGTDHRRFRAFELKGRYWHYRPRPEFAALYEIHSDADLLAAINSDQYRDWSEDFLERWRDGTKDEVSTICKRIY